MFLEHFGLIEQPFGVTPDPRFLHLGAQHREALASLVYGTETQRGFLALIGPPGMGKTTLLYQFLEGQRDRARTAFVFQTDCQPRELLRHILGDLGLEAAGKDLPSLREMLNGVLVEEMNAGRRFILVIDEAQNLQEKILESVRLLSNFETPWKKLMQIVIAGQPQLGEQLARPSMAQLRQRISAVIRLRPFSAEETQTYMAHRLWVAGYAGPELFTVGARLKIAEASGGIPRNINNLCFNAMSLGYAAGAKRIDAKMVDDAIEDLKIEAPAPGAPAAQQPAAEQPRIRAYGSPGLLGGPAPMAEPRAARGRVLKIAASFAAMSLLGLGAGILRPGGERLPSFEELRTAEAGVRQSVQRKLEQTFFRPVEAAARTSSDPLENAGWPAPPILTIAPPAGAAAPAAAGANSATGMAAVSETPSGDGTMTVIATGQETLGQLSLRYLGRYDLRTVDEIFVLNPGISDANHLAAGQEIRLPLFMRAEGWQPAEEAALPSRSANEEKP